MILLIHPNLLGAPFGRLVEGTVRVMATTAKTFLVRPIALLALIAAALATAGCGINNIPTYDQSAKAAGARFSVNISGAPI